MLFLKISGRIDTIICISLLGKCCTKYIWISDMLVSNKEISGELVSLCFGKEIMAEQNAIAAAKSELTLAVSHSAMTAAATFDTYSGVLIIHERWPENSLNR